MICRICGKEFDPKEGVGHIDDHIEVCPTCYPKFKKMTAIKTTLLEVGRHLAKTYRIHRARTGPMYV